ncbi:condensation domain-containing protein [Micromonospora sp. NBS 11-29]|uniref:condensation domain-containing protein n=1 Tax=Micromonospora sp. NBS 11-29 TaxID=1960879 RepID=UPI00159463F7|nr:condensation domain-containing protein [Micromonospora sp. NBS 11-29]
MDEHLTARVRELWQAVLGVPDIGAESNFFELGGHSMLATRLMARTRKRLDVELPANLIFEFPVFAEFVARVAAAAPGDAPAGPVPTGAEHGPLSLQQQQLMRVESALGPSPANKVALVLEVEAADGARIDAQRLRQALRAVIDRHAVLRTVFRPDGTAAVRATGGDDDPLDEYDLRERAPDDASRRILRRVRQAHLRPFDLAAGGLLRAQLFRRGGGVDLLALHLHHIACDGRSQQVLVDDLAAAYAAPDGGGPEGVAYLDYAVWQERHAAATLRRSRPHWRGVIRELTGDPTRAPGGRPGTFATARSAAVVPPRTVAALRRWSAAEGTTSFVVLAAATATAVARLTGSASVGLGTLLENRPLAEVERTVGPFANSTLLAVPAPAGVTPRELVRRTGERLDAARQWSDLPLETLLAEPAADAAVDPGELVDVVLSVEMTGATPPGDGLRLRPVADDGPPLLPVSVGAHRTVHARLDDGDGMRLAVEHADDPTEAARARALLDAVAALLSAFVAAPEAALPDGIPDAALPEVGPR